MEIKSEDEINCIFLPGNSVYIQNFINKSIADYLFSELEKEIKYIPRGELKFLAPNGKNIPLPRVKQFYGTVCKNGDIPIYRYGTEKYPNILPWTKTLKIIRDLLERESCQNCNHLVLNRYENENDYIGYHRDKTKSLVPNSKVIVLSLGETRTMDIQEIYKPPARGQKSKINGKNKTRKIFETEMVHGSLFELTLKTNLNHKHQIRKTKTSKKVRLGLTFRQVREFVNIKTGKYYFK